ncbi:hypothetical protein HYQ45_002458 [Verticillium longisporum]|uniref:Uncharacterized protein n=4 Tax=Verticillium TaxID=1036719 RepID=G2X8U6_VERDV|nr:uncharacterized protein VDAG_06237 [Verticillium dahliae VdLs.17]KAG7140741.1 hypothetical protein HYQ45_002458 [Verticillium longisporum]KAH6698036.1 hypothetical protein EV126DRAFT_515446 [Verticillium dahliae]EGY15383.1 hypothetical protein VDAG_06237 [Verticillium dahliae VdLs.17]PNH27179.1 hypothetical protein BJF96_g9526 [Verticillium dahliae]PNH46602.1 hypothetical protein VD0004_g1559 [Verticillium dahliae]
MHLPSLSVLVALALGSHSVVAQNCRGNVSSMWRCLRSDNTNSGYTTSCCPRTNSFMENGACCTTNWSAFQSCCSTHNGYFAANG